MKSQKPTCFIHSNLHHWLILKYKKTEGKGYLSDTNLCREQTPGSLRVNEATGVINSHGSLIYRAPTQLSELGLRKTGSSITPQVFFF
jgi:hypothetical protein